MHDSKTFFPLFSVLISIVAWISCKYVSNKHNGRRKKSQRFSACFQLANFICLMSIIVTKHFTLNFDSGTQQQKFELYSHPSSKKINNQQPQQQQLFILVKYNM
jgi:hypothetical protein